MDDHKLLELAARSVGWVHLTNGETCDPKRGNFYWDPLADDGDALRLAAHLRLKVLPGKHKGDGCSVESQHAGVAGCTAFRDDPAEQMRRAIVHVAAEIGASL